MQTMLPPEQHSLRKRVVIPAVGVLVFIIVLLSSSAHGQATPLFDLIADGLIEEDPLVLPFNGGLDGWGYDDSYASQMVAWIDLTLTHPMDGQNNQLVKLYDNQFATGGGLVDVTQQVLDPAIWASIQANPTTDPNSVFDRVYEMRQFRVGASHLAGWVLVRHQKRDTVLQWDFGLGYYKVTGVVGSDELSEHCKCAGGGSGIWDQSGMLPDFCDRRWTTGQDNADIDGDFDRDLVTCYRDGRPRYFKNDGLGGFSEAQALPPDPDEVNLGLLRPGIGNRDIHLADLDGDGDQDLIVARMHSNGSNDCQHAGLTAAIVYKFDETDQTVPGGTYVYWYRLRPGVGEDIEKVGGTWQSKGFGSSSLSLSVADLDNDGAIDLVQPILDSPDGNKKVRVYMNDGTGHLGGGSHRPSGYIGDPNRSVAFASLEDLNDDGRIDVVLCYLHGNTVAQTNDKVYLNFPGAPGAAIPRFRFAQAIPSQLGAVSDNTRYVRFADFDDDGDLDYIESNFLDGANTRVFFNTTYN